MSLKRKVCVGAVTAATLVTAGAAHASTPTISEAGSSLAYPIASVWAARYAPATVNVSAGGSARGISAVTSGQVDIGAVDNPLTPEQFNSGAGDYLQIPWALSATGIGYNIAGVKTGLKLTAKLIAEIYTGKVTRWGDSAITRLNPADAGALRKAGKITPVFRSDGSGESYTIQVYLEKAAPSVWDLGDSDVFAGKVGDAEEGNASVATKVESTPGAIGYMSGAYLLQQHLSVAAIGNAAGKFEYPNIANIVDAASSDTTISTQGADFTGVSIVDPPAKYSTAYPIATYSYAVVSRSDANRDAVKSFLDWVVSPTGGQQYGVSLDFAPLPAAIRSEDTNLLSGL